MVSDIAQAEPPLAETTTTEKGVKFSPANSIDCRR
jgi:hypothetical protein